MDYISIVNMNSSNKAILVTSFGTSYNDNRERTIGAIERDIGKAYPDWTVRRAFTSKMIIKKIAQRDGIHIDYITDALNRLAEDGFKKIIVQPTTIMNAIEYDDVVAAVDKYCSDFSEISIGRPLLDSEEDYNSVVSALESAQIKDADSISGGRVATILMGHGTEHHANPAYSQLYLKLVLSGHPDVFVTTVEGFPSFEDTLKLMKGRGFTDVALFPFMMVAGDHANNDLAGDEPDSLKSLCECEGYKVHCILKGLGEYPDFRKIFVERVRETMSQ